MPPSIQDESTTTSSGIITLSTGERAIPSSTRADGSTRKEIRIRPGYKPPEDIAVYKNRTAEAFKNRGKGGIPGVERAEEDGDLGASGKASNKNAKRREARRKAKAAEVETAGAGEEEDAVAVGAAGKDNGVNGDTKEEKNRSLPNGEAAVDQNAEEQVEREKRVRKLKKKLREARELQEKKEKGEALLHEQFEKVIRINELVRDLDKLGFNADGEQKED